MGSALSVPTEWHTESDVSSSRCKESLTIKYLQAADLSQELETDTLHTLAVIDYSGSHSLPATRNSLALHVHLPPLTRPPFFELWKSSTPVLPDQVQDIRLAFTDEFVFGCLEAVEHSGKELEDLSRAAYERIFEYCAQSGFSHLLRMWNYFPDINAEPHGLERYKRFCIGRHQAFSASYQEFASILPAASAVGTQGGPFQILFLAGKQPGRPLENPRQISAYEYPTIYGPKSPSFSRATLQQTPTGCQLFVAGTASIVGHATHHYGDPEKQTFETLTNIEAILNRVCHEGHGCWDENYSEGRLKVFVRNQGECGLVREALERHKLGKGHILYVLGEMCRKELLVEIEGIWNLTSLPHKSKHN